MILTKLEKQLKAKLTKLQAQTKVSLMILLNLQVIFNNILVYSYECPDLTLIDLPGITRISVGQQFDIERVTTDMAKRYCT
jgi:hypothetical protein